VIDVDALREDARAVADRRLARARGLLLSVAPEEKLAIEEVAHAVALGVADCLIEEAAKNSLVEAALSH
jgi:hypothetical protein